MNGKYSDQAPVNGALIQAAEPARVGEPSPEIKTHNPHVKKDGSKPEHWQNQPAMQMPNEE